MKARILTGFIIGLTFFGFPPSGLSHSEGINLLVDVKGNVQIKRVKWFQFQRANIGDLLSRDDWIQLEANASATLLCGNTEKWQVESGKISRVSEGCPSGTTTLLRPNIPRRTPRAPNETIPYIISPRNTALLTKRPRLRWNVVPGTTRYRVRLEVLGQNYWQTETSKTQIEYPGEPPLQAGDRYLLIVETDKGTSSKDEEGNLRFTVLDESRAESLRAEIAKLKQQGLSQDAEGLALAYLYQGYELNAEALELLEELIRGGSQTTAVYQLLGDLYLQSDLSQQAKAFYLKALELAKHSEDLEGQAQAQVGLGEANDGLGKREEAVEWLTKAKENYAALGEESHSQELEQRINSFLNKE